MVIKFRFMEYVGAFTLTGYIIAELRSRKQETARESRYRFRAGMLICTTGITVLRGFHPCYSASLTEWGWFTGFGLFGGWIYRLRRDAVRRFCPENYARDSEALRDVCE
ncbi:hypothetical protein DENIS_2984 [Desulfonema ishimotonii]|uniref:Uncharacterized protein n=1 Tax=Desulfonema ishimotonii TaxID=45657 RepID=A0A401FYH9_9BACT|nr:hypothetical protein [Desulfonema ishimotonii]GBC62021.1 hypothetical protein DENIS_2984 [Desulfonema ishimotonii]